MASRDIIRESKRRLAKTNLGKLEKLFAERSRWMRKQTIATNKLARVQRSIDALAAEMARKTYEDEFTNAS